MHTATQCAEQAEMEGEVPVGAVLMQINQLIAKGWNQVITQHDPSAHAEIQEILHKGF